VVSSRREIPWPEKLMEVGDMGTFRQTQIRIVKKGSASEIPGPQAEPVPTENRAKDPTAEVIRSISGWVAEFKERRRPDPWITFQSLFKEV
jgi:hypothetical protein